MSDLEQKVLDRKRIKKIKTLVWQNVTEGPMTPALKAADIVLLSEVGWIKLLRGRRGCKHYRPRMAKGMAISWKKSEFIVTHKGFNLFHYSGKREKWPHIQTPNRGVLWVIGYWADDPSKVEYCYWTTWFLNSWFPIKPDKWTIERRAIVRKRSIPILEDTISYILDGYATGALGGGDTNSIPWNGELKGMTQIHGAHSLDRIWKAGETIHVRQITETAETGIGNDRRHEGIRVKVLV